MGAMAEFLTDIKTIRERARAEIDKGPITDAYGADLERVIQVCNEALATELVCVLRYKRHHYTASGLQSESVAAEFLEHAGEEQEHADKLAARIVQLGGAPDFNPDTLSSRAHSQYDESRGLIDMIKEDLVAGEPFASVCEAFADLPAEEAATTAASLLVCWVKDGMVCSLDPERRAG